MWKEISSAPRDEIVMLFVPEWRMEFYDENGVHCVHVWELATIQGQWEDDPEKWRAGFVFCEPTHWMPLPAPPHTEIETERGW